MKGMDLSRAYCERYAASLFAGGLEGLRQRCALGLVGPGSECLGFDDEISRDHDFGSGFCIWLEPADFAAFGAELQRRYDELPREFMGYRRVSTPLSGKRTGVFDADEFRMRYTGLASAPSSSKEWLFIPQQLLAEFTAGEIFSDPAGLWPVAAPRTWRSIPKPLFKRRSRPNSPAWRRPANTICRAAFAATTSSRRTQRVQNLSRRSWL